jgi:hypothetical protein
MDPWRIRRQPGFAKCLHTKAAVRSWDKDLAAAIDRCIADAWSYYVLSCDSVSARNPDEYRSLQAKVNKPGVTHKYVLLCSAIKGHSPPTCEPSCRFNRECFVEVRPQNRNERELSAPCSWTPQIPIFTVSRSQNRFLKNTKSTPTMTAAIAIT